MDHRRFISALVYVGKTGCWWKHIPASFGKYKTLHSRFTDWSKRGVFEVLLNQVRDLEDPSVLRYLDTAFVKCSICALTGKASENQRVTGKTKGGFTTKVAAICDSKQRVHAVCIGPGNESDHSIGRRIELPGKNKIIVADKGFSSRAFREQIESSGHRHCVAQKNNEKTHFPFNKAHYRKRRHVENLYARMRRWTRLELRRERLPCNFLSFVCLWSVGTWVKY